MNLPLFICFCWERHLYQSLCLCFGLPPALYVFTKLLKILIPFLRRIDTLIIIYLDMLSIGRTAVNDQMYYDTVILLLQQLGIVDCDKSKEVRDEPLTGDGVSGYDNELQRNDYLSSRRETPKTKIVMFKFVSETTSFNLTIDESVRTSYINNPGCPSNTAK